MRFPVVAVLVAAAAFAAAPVTVTDVRVDGVDLRILLPEVTITTDVAAGERYCVAALPEAGLADHVGRPAVPVYRRLVEVPFGAQVSVEAEPVESEEVPLPARLMPRQEPVPKSGPVPAFARDVQAYAKAGFEPAIGARVVSVAEMRGHRVATVEVTPVSYDPSQGRLRVCRELRVKVSWTGADIGLTEAMRRRYDSPVFAGRVRDAVVNPPAFGLDGPPELPVGYLIIVPDAWQANVQPLAEWRRRKGWHVFVRTLSQVGGGQANTVLNYIQQAYDNWPIPPSMVMLVGDVDQIGFFTGQGAGSPHTDLNFTMLAGGDYLPDIDLCRASVANAAQLDSLVQKTLRYEQDPGSVGTDWLDKAYFIASSDGGNHQVTEATHLYCMRKLRALGVVCDSIWLYYGQGTPITTAVNGGRSWVTYSGHGNTDCWADPEPNFDLAAVHALTNAGMVPWVQTYACLSGDYTSTTYPECFSEAWIRNGTRGAVAHMASTVTSYWTEDDTLQRRVFDYMFDSLDCLVGGGVNRAKLKYYEQMGNNSTTRRYFEMYNVIGDGAIDVFSQQPAALTVTHPPVIPLGAYPLQVTVQRSGLPVRDALVCAAGRDDTTVFASAYTDGAGQVVLNITTTAPDSVFVTVTGHNLEPYLGACLARPSSGPYVMLLRTAVDDSSGGNNDGIINPGETINLPAWLKNWGSAAAENVRAWLRCQDPNVTLLDSLKTFGTIAAHDSASTGPDGFGFSVAASCTNGYGLRFTLAVKDANDSTWTSSLNLAVGAPVLGYVSNRADDPPPGGNGNGMIEPGETGELMVELRNTGLGHAYNVTAVLRSGDSRLAVLDSTGSYPVILRDSTALNAADRFRVHADASIPRETRVPCTLEVAVGGATYTRVFELGIGVIRVCDPIPDGPRQPSVYYAYDDTDTMYTGRPQFNWVEIRGLGTRLSLSDDQTVTISLPAGFGPWIYYGQSHNQVSICSNGWVAPGQTAVTTYNNTSLPNTSMPAAVFINWDDLYPPAGGGVWYYHDEASHRFIVEYDSVRYYSGTNCDKNQVIIYDTTVAAGDNHIVLQYLTANQTGSATVGLQDHTRSVMIEALFNGAYHRGCAALAPGRAMMMAAVPPAVGVAGPGDESPGRLGFVRCGPNPLRGRASIVYSVPRATNVSLAVFDAAGRLVRSLQRGEQRPGIHAATWDRTDGQGRPVSHGVYFYRLEADGVRLARKVVAVR